MVGEHKGSEAKNTECQAKKKKAEQKGTKRAFEDEAEDIDKEVEELGEAEQLENGFELVGEHTERDAKSNEFQAEQTNAKADAEIALAKEDQDYLNKVEELAQKVFWILEGRQQVMASRF